MNTCPNCGAPRAFDRDNKCQYCGAILLDMAMVDFDHRVPIFLNIKYDGIVKVHKCIPTACRVEVSSDDTSLYADNTVCTVMSRENIDISVDFHVV